MNKNSEIGADATKITAQFLTKSIVHKDEITYR